MTQKELNLFEFAARAVAKPGTSAAKIMGCKMIDANLLGVTFYCAPDHVGRYSKTQFGFVLPNSPKNLAVGHP
jgi:hypothetical protein